MSSTESRERRRARAGLGMGHRGCAAQDRPQKVSEALWARGIGEDAERLFACTDPGQLDRRRTICSLSPGLLIDVLWIRTTWRLRCRRPITHYSFCSRPEKSQNPHGDLEVGIMIHCSKCTEMQSVLTARLRYQNGIDSQHVRTVKEADGGERPLG